MPSDVALASHPFAPGCRADPYRCYRTLLVDGPRYEAFLDAWFVGGYADVVSGLRATHTEADLAARAFVRYDTTALRNRVRHACEHALQRVRSGQLDVVRDYAAAVTESVVPELLGVQHSDRERFLQWCKAIHRAELQLDQRESLGRVGAEARRALAAHVTRLIADRRAEPRDDLLGALVAAGSDSEVLECMVPLVIAGTETTTNLLGLGMLALLKHPDQLRLLEGSPDLAPAAVEELLRYCGPVQMTARRGPAVVAGQSVRSGQVVMLVLAAANRDPAVFSVPNELDLTRADNRHLAFGLGGLDALGAPLVRLQAEIALQTLLRRLPNLEVVDQDLSYQDIPTLRGLHALLVRTG